MSTPTPDWSVLAVHSQAQDHIDRHGWSVVAVGADTDHPPRCYTVGLTEKTRPELFMCGAAIEQMYLLVNQLAARAVARPLPYGHGTALDDLLGGEHIAVIIDGTENPDLPLGMANGRYGRDRVRVQQLVWPDTGGRYPWHADYDHAGCPQPLLHGVDTAALA